LTAMTGIAMTIFLIEGLLLYRNHPKTFKGLRIQIGFKTRSQCSKAFDWFKLLISIDSHIPWKRLETDRFVAATTHSHNFIPLRCFVYVC
jgi:hypothetical protein